jgi:hypothetical protein
MKPMMLVIILAVGPGQILSGAQWIRDHGFTAKAPENAEKRPFLCALRVPCGEDHAHVSSRTYIGLIPIPTLSQEQDEGLALIEKLRSDDPQVRQAATRSLVRKGPSARHALTQVAKDQDAEVVARVKRVLAVIDTNERARLSYWPLAEGFSWTYIVEKSEENFREVLIQIGKPIEIPLIMTEDQKAQATKGWTLKGFVSEPAFAVDLGDGILLGRGDRGLEGPVMHVPRYELRWGKARVWRSWTIEGCIGGFVEGARGDVEKIGTLDCLSIHNSYRAQAEPLTTTFWLAKGVGPVRVRQGDRTWELKSHRTHLEE